MGKKQNRGGLQLGAFIGPFMIIRLLGEGGMGTVYLAEQQSPNRQVALKVMTRFRGKGSRQQARFLREMELGSQLDHQNIAKTYVAGTESGIPYLAMEYVQGETFGEYVKRVKPSLNKKLQLISIVATALHYAHQKGIIHRDLKPSNIMIRTDGQPVIMDFGLARSMRIHDKRLTQTGEILETPSYMPIEQVQGKRQIDHRVDVYSLGAVLYEIITGQPLFSGNTMQILYNIISSVPVMPRRITPELPVAIETIILKSIEKNRVRRYQSSREMSRDIENYLARRKVTANARQLFIRWHVARHKEKIAVTIFMMILLVIFIPCYRMLSQNTRQQQKRPVVHRQSIDEQIESLDRQLQKQPSVEIYQDYIQLLEKHNRYLLATQICKKAAKWANECNKTAVNIFYYDRNRNLLAFWNKKLKPYHLYQVLCHLYHQIKRGHIDQPNDVEAEKVST